MMRSGVVDRIFYSQFGEDRLIHEIFRHKSNGFCIEVGANDGVNDSTTIFFEKIGWDCLLIEPNPELCKAIREVRTGLLFECAVSDKPGDATLYVAEGAERSHGVSTICEDQEAHERILNYGFTVKPVMVKAMTLNEILSASKINAPIDFLSIDVEGHELAVLRGFALDTWNPTLILVEDNSNNKDKSVSEYLSTFGYIPFMRTGVNNWYARETNHELLNWKYKNLSVWSTYNRIVCVNKWQSLKNKIKRVIRKLRVIV